MAVNKRSVELVWTDNSNNEDGFQIQRSQDGGNNWTQIVQTGPSVTSYLDARVKSKTTYLYHVRAFNGAGVSAWSNTLQVTTP